MHGKLRLLLICLQSVSPIFAQTPDWVEGNGQCSRYPAQTYLVGFGASKQADSQNMSETIQAALSVARKNLIERVRVTVSSSATSRVEETDRSLMKSFGSLTNTSSCLELQGLESETHYDPNESTGYALAYIKKQNLVEDYARKLEKGRSQVIENLESGKRYATGGNRQKALETYLACYPLLQGMEEAEAILFVVGEDVRMRSHASYAMNDLSLAAQVRAAVEHVMNTPVSSLDDAAWYLAYCLSQSSGVQGRTVSIDYPCYQDSRMGSRFSQYFRQSLVHKAAEIAKLKVHEGLNPVNEGESQPEYVVSCNYWPQSEGTRLLASLMKMSDGKITGGAEVVIPDNLIKKARLSLVPDNFAEAASDQKSLATSQLPVGGLEIEVTTNKGADGVVFAKGEQMQVYLKVNVPCYVRFVYHQANRDRVLLINNEYIDESKINKWYPASRRFECDAPFGAEFLQVFAQTEAFDHVPTVDKNGRPVIVENLDVFLSHTRGFKPTKSRAMQAEKRIVVTTIEKP